MLQEREDIRIQEACCPVLGDIVAFVNTYIHFNLRRNPEWATVLENFSCHQITMCLLNRLARACVRWFILSTPTFPFILTPQTRPQRFGPLSFIRNLDFPYLGRGGEGWWERASQPPRDYRSKIKRYGQRRYVTLFSYPNVSEDSHRYLLQRSQELKDTRDQNTGFTILSGTVAFFHPPEFNHLHPDMVRLRYSLSVSFLPSLYLSLSPLFLPTPSN